MGEIFWQFAQTLLLVMGICLVVSITGLALMVRSIRRIRVPSDADFFTTMRYVPLVLVILLDLLDFALDIFSAPIVWLVLDRMGLQNLRNKAVIEALIPVTGPIPTFTIAWLLARLLNLGDLPGIRRPGGHTSRRALEEGYDYANYPRRPRRPPQIIDMERDDR